MKHKISEISTHLVAAFIVIFVAVPFAIAATTIDANITTGGNLSVTGTSSLSGLVTVGANGIQFDDETTLTTAPTSFDGDLTGNLTVSGNSTLGDAAADTITFTGVMNSGITFIKEVARTIQIDDSTTADTAGAALTIKSAAGNGTGAGGAVNIQSGASGSGATGNGGTVAFTAANAASTNGSGGPVTITAGNATGTGGGGGITMTAGNAAASAEGADVGGDITLTAGTGGTGDSVGGHISITGGYGGTNASVGHGGTVTISGGIGGTPTISPFTSAPRGGDITIKAGTGGTSTSGGQGQGGAATFQGGDGGTNAVSTGGQGGATTLRAGDGSSGDGGKGRWGGVLTIRGGNGGIQNADDPYGEHGADGGYVSINGGSASGTQVNDGGHVNIQGGTAGSTGVPGGIRLGSARITIANKPTAPVALADSNATPTVAQILDAGIFVMTPTATRTFTMPTAQGAAGLVRQLPATGMPSSGARPQAGDVFQFFVANNGTAANLIDLTNGTGSTFNGPDIAGGTARWVICRITSTTTDSETIACY